MANNFSNGSNVEIKSDSDNSCPSELSLPSTIFRNFVKSEP